MKATPHTQSLIIRECTAWAVPFRSERDNDGLPRDHEQRTRVRRGRAFLVAWTMVLGYVAGMSLPQEIPGHTRILFDSQGVDVAMVDVIR